MSLQYLLNRLPFDVISLSFSFALYECKSLNKGFSSLPRFLGGRFETLRRVGKNRDKRDISLSDPQTGVQNWSLRESDMSFAKWHCRCICAYRLKERNPRTGILSTILVYARQGFWHHHLFVCKSPFGHSTQSFTDLIILWSGNLD